MQEGNRVRVHARVSGRVQGVGFRWHCHRAACARLVGGWVRNMPDGAVELEAEGPAGVVALFLDDVRRGPGAGRVDDVDVTGIETEGGSEFSIR